MAPITVLPATTRLVVHNGLTARYHCYHSNAAPASLTTTMGRMLLSPGLQAKNTGGGFTHSRRSGSLRHTALVDQISPIMRMALQVSVSCRWWNGPTSHAIPWWTGGWNPVKLLGWRFYQMKHRHTGPEGFSRRNRAIYETAQNSDIESAITSASAGSYNTHLLRSFLHSMKGAEKPPTKRLPSGKTP